MAFIHSLLLKWHFFYRRIIGETDDFMVYYYSVFAVLMLIVINIWTLGLYLNHCQEVETMAYSKERYGLVLIVVFTIGFYYFFKVREDLEKKPLKGAIR